MSTWEERMAQRAAIRAADELGTALAEDYEHAGHHSHLIGTMVQCSCGTDFGVTCVAFPGEFFTMTDEQKAAYWDSLTCSICGRHGMVSMQ